MSSTTLTERRTKRPAAFKPAGQMVRYDAMCQAIANAHEVDEVKDIRDKAVAIEVYARQAKNTEAERQACEIRLRAERRVGQMLSEMEKAKGGGDQRSVHRSTKPRSDPQTQTLGELGISHDQSSKWQKLGRVPEDEFEASLSKPKPTTSGVIKQHFPPPPSPRDQVPEEALWLWGRLQDFKRDGLLRRDPKQVVADMLPHMQATVRELAPLVATWLGRIK